MPSVSKEFYWTSDDWLFNRIKRDIELNAKNASKWRKKIFAFRMNAEKNKKNFEGSSVNFWVSVFSISTILFLNG